MAGKKSKKTSRASETEEERPQIRVVTPQSSPMADEATQLVNELINLCIEMSFEAVGQNHNCVFYDYAVKIAKVVKKLYKLRRRG